MSHRARQIKEQEERNAPTDLNTVLTIGMHALPRTKSIECPEVKDLEDAIRKIRERHGVNYEKAVEMAKIRQKLIAAIQKMDDKCLETALGRLKSRRSVMYPDSDSDSEFDAFLYSVFEKR